MCILAFRYKPGMSLEEVIKLDEKQMGDTEEERSLRRRAFIEARSLQIERSVEKGPYRIGLAYTPIINR